jgi:hypothetical protein
MLAACASQKPLDLPSPPTPPPTPPVVEQIKVKPVLVDLHRNSAREAANGGSAVVLLRTEPRSSYENLATCLALKSQLEVVRPEQIAVGVEQVGEAVHAYRPVYWLTVNGAGVRNEDCVEALRVYDYERADVVRRKYALSGPGPHLLVTRKDESQAAVINLSNRSATDIHRYVSLFSRAFAFERDVWDASAMPVETRRTLLQDAFGTDFHERLLNAIAFIASPAVRAGCALGDLGDAACE